MRSARTRAMEGPLGGRYSNGVPRSALSIPNALVTPKRSLEVNPRCLVLVLLVEQTRDSHLPERTRHPPNHLMRLSLGPETTIPGPTAKFSLSHSGPASFSQWTKYDYRFPWKEQRTDFPDATTDPLANSAPNLYHMILNNNMVQ
jgi:hypothetical protein